MRRSFHHSNGKWKFFKVSGHQLWWLLAQSRMHLDPGALEVWTSCRGKGPWQAQLLYKERRLCIFGLQVQEEEILQVGAPKGRVRKCLCRIVMVWLEIYIYMQMGTLRGYSVNNPCSISRDCSPTPRWLKTPNQAKKRARSSAMHNWNAGNSTQDFETISQPTYPEQG